MWQKHTAHLARLEAQVAETMVKAGAVDWIRRQEEHREEEWKVRAEVLAMARKAIARWEKNENRCGSLEGVARLLELASKLGRLASGMATDRTEVNWDIAAGQFFTNYRREVHVLGDFDETQGDGMVGGDGLRLCALHGGARTVTKRFCDRCSLSEL